MEARFRIITVTVEMQKLRGIKNSNQLQRASKNEIAAAQTSSMKRRLKIGIKKYMESKFKSECC
jgi:hypothetical protein